VPPLCSLLTIQTAVGLRQGGKGSGLGLALCRNSPSLASRTALTAPVVKISGGRLGVKSRAGVGTTMWLEIALRRQNPDTPPTDDDPALLHNLSPLAAITGPPPAPALGTPAKSPYMGGGAAGRVSPNPGLSPRRPDLNVQDLEPQMRPSGLALLELPPLTPPAAEDEPPPSLSILVCEDDRLTRMLLRRMCVDDCRRTELTTAQADATRAYGRRGRERAARAQHAARGLDRQGRVPLRSAPPRQLDAHALGRRRHPCVADSERG